MKKATRILFLISVLFLVLFALWTALVSFIDVAPIGPENSKVGFATLNGAFHQVTGVHLWMYDASDLLSLIPLGIIGGFVGSLLLGLIGLGNVGAKVANAAAALGMTQVQVSRREKKLLAAMREKIV